MIVLACPERLCLMKCQKTFCKIFCLLLCILQLNNYFLALFIVPFIRFNVAICMLCYNVLVCLLVLHVASYLSCIVCVLPSYLAT